MANTVKYWQARTHWSEAEHQWDARARQLGTEYPLRTFKKNPDLPGIRPKTRHFLWWKSLAYLHHHDSSGQLRRYFWQHPFKHGFGLLKNLLAGKNYVRDGDFFLYGFTNAEQFEQRLMHSDALLVAGFSYCHKPFECPSGRFTDQCVHDLASPVCGQCFIGKAVHSLPPARVEPLFITTVHYLGEKLIEAQAAWPAREILFLVTACELTLEMFGVAGNAIGLRGIGVRLDGQICNTLRAFEASEKGIKPGMAIVEDETQRRMMAILRDFSATIQSSAANDGGSGAGNGRDHLIATDAAWHQGR